MTFLKVEDAEKFLAAHGQARNSTFHRPTRLSNATVILKFMNQPIYFERSIKAADPHHLKVLAKEEENREAAIKNKKTTTVPGEEYAAPKILPAAFEVTSVSCGVWDYDSKSDLVFATQLKWEHPGEAKFIEGSMILSEIRIISLSFGANTLPTGLENAMRVDFPYSSTTTILSESGANPSFTFSMKEPPRLYESVLPN